MFAPGSFYCKESKLQVDLILQVIWFYKFCEESKFVELNPGKSYDFALKVAGNVCFRSFL